MVRDVEVARDFVYLYRPFYFTALLIIETFFDTFQRCIRVHFAGGVQLRKIHLSRKDFYLPHYGSRHA